MSRKGEPCATNSCPTGKLAYQTRAAAHDACVRARKRGEHCRPYRCEECSQHHIGHLPSATVRGQMAADDYYRRYGSAS